MVVLVVTESVAEDLLNVCSSLGSDLTERGGGGGGGGNDCLLAASACEVDNEFDEIDVDSSPASVCRFVIELDELLRLRFFFKLKLKLIFFIHF